jgi:hypothetical protein
MSAPRSPRCDAGAALADSVAAHGETDRSCAELTDRLVAGLRRRGYGYEEASHGAPRGHSYAVALSGGERWIVDAREPYPDPVRLKIWRHGEVRADQEPEVYGAA